ncbi:MAG: hypothetical protein ACPGJS_01555 [Flammeovirgaceae bacterium]
MELFKELASTDYYFLGFNKESHILLMKLMGDMTDEQYKESWKRSFQITYEKGIEKLIIDQREIGNVSFAARAWVMVKMYPKIKKELSPNLMGAIISSSHIIHRSGVQYLVKAFQRVSGYQIKFQDSYESSITWLNEVERLQQTGQVIN